MLKQNLDISKKSYKESFSKRNAFTLAEVLITLAVIGVVAAMTIPTLLSNIKSKANTTKKEVFKARILNGLKETAVQDTLMGYESTMEFAQALGKHYKMFNICDTDNIKICYNVDEVTINSDGEMLAVSDITKAKILNLKEENGWLNPVTIVTTDGIIFIMSYNKNCAITESELQGIKDEVTGGYSKAETALSCISGVIDVNGVSAPNIQGKDILSFQNGRLKSAGLKIPYSTFEHNGKTYEVSKQLARMNWYNAMTECSKIGGSLPDSSELGIIYTHRKDLMLTTPTGFFWSSTEYDTSKATGLGFYTPAWNNVPKTDNNNVVCIAK